MAHVIFVALEIYNNQTSSRTVGSWRWWSQFSHIIDVACPRRSPVYLTDRRQSTDACPSTSNTASTHPPAPQLRQISSFSYFIL